MMKPILLVLVIICVVSLGSAGPAQSKGLARCPDPDRKGTPVMALGAWTKGTPLPTPRSEAASAALGGLIYVGGGIDGTHQASTAFEVYDPAGNAWRKAAPLPAALHQLAMAGAAGHIYVSGGLDGSQAAVNKAWAYDAGANTWAPIADMPAARSGHTMVAFGNQLYVMGGQLDPTALWT